MSLAIWWAPIATPAPTELLDPVEQGRWQRYRRSADRQRFALGVAITRTVLGTRLGLDPASIPLTRACATCAEAHGPPRLAGSGVELSVAHSGDVVAVAFGPIPVGLDVERVDPTAGRHVGTATLALTPGELRDWQRLPPDRQAGAFYATWARKEAVLKATGDGLMLPLSGLEVTRPTEPPAVRAWSERPALADRVWLTDLDPWPGYAAALAALDHDGTPPTLHRWPGSGPVG